MRLRTFTAHDMPAAMKMVRSELGEHAIILSTDNKGKGPVTLTAAVDDDARPHNEKAEAKKPESAPRPSVNPKAMQHSNEEADQLRYDIQEVLRFHNMPELFIAKMMQQATDKWLAALQALQHIGARKGKPNRLLQLSLEKILEGYFSFQPLDFSKAGKRLMLVGPPGIGKTLTIAKIAASLVMNDEQGKRDTVVITTDNKRAGGFEQLQSLTSIMGVELHAANDTKELKKIVAACKPRARVLIDTAGCNPYDNAEMNELKAYAKLDDVEPVMVLPAGGDSLEAIDVVESFMALPVERLLVTRTDTAKRFGGILAAAAAHKLAFCHVSSSSSIIDSLQPVDAAGLAGLLLHYKKLTNS
jgi:flagellar biosynthesis protein FlhF